MKRILLLSVYLLLILPLTVNATGGGLRKNSLKTCPNGITYGLHSDGHGGTHWHIAVTNGNNYYADGEAIYNDPCPGYTQNEGTAGATDGSNNSSWNSSGNSNSNSYSNDNVQTNKTEEVTIERSKDNSIKKVVIDGEEITVSDNMSFNTEKKHVDIEVETNDSKSKVDYENKDLMFGDNEINIYVTAENGDKRNYILTINKIKNKGTATIKKIVIDGSEVQFNNNKATVKELKGETSLDYSYELSDKKAKLKIYLNEIETDKLDSLKENDQIKLIVLDENDNENVYDIIIKDYSIVFSVMVYFVSTIIGVAFLSIPVIIIIIFNKEKKNKKINNVKSNMIGYNETKEINQNKHIYDTENSEYINNKINEFNNKYDLTSVNGIMSIPISEAQKYSDGGISAVYMPEQILNRKATEYKNAKNYDLSIACLKKVNELYPYSFYSYTRDDYERLVDIMVLAGRFEEAKTEHKKLDELYGTRVDELKSIQKLLLRQVQKAWKIIKNVLLILILNNSVTGKFIIGCWKIFHKLHLNLLVDIEE